MTAMPEMVAAENSVVGEGPVWDPKARVLYWTDIRTGRLFKFDPSTGSNETIHRGVYIGGFAVNRHGGLVLGTWEGVMLWRSDSDWQWWRHDPERGGTMRFNDCKAGPDGSFYAGSYYDGASRGQLFRFHTTGEVEEIAGNLGISNGMGWSPDLTVFYHTDSLTKTIYRHDYDPVTHAISGRAEFAKVPSSMGIPDGMTVDSEGYVWSAIWGSGCVLRFDPSGRWVDRIDFPATQISSVMFGGEGLADIYVTSANSGAGGPPSGMEPAGYDFSAHRGGELYCVRKSGFSGKPEFEADFRWRNS